MSGSAGAYARAVEREWSRLLGRPVVLSPRDWALLSDWHARSVPLEIVVEAIRSVGERIHRGAAPPRSLGYIATAVEESWGVVLDGRLAEHEDGEAGRNGGPSVRAAWRQRVEAERPGSALHALLSRLLRGLESGARPAAELDRQLERELPDAVDDVLQHAAAADVDRRLEGFRSRMTPEVFAATRRRALGLELRRRLGLPALSPCSIGGSDFPADPAARE